MSAPPPPPPSYDSLHADPNSSTTVHDKAPMHRSPAVRNAMTNDQRKAFAIAQTATTGPTVVAASAPAFKVVSSAAKAPAANLETNFLNFTLNGEPITVEPSTISPNMTVAAFIRERTKWRGTKISCNEGGCGACTVALTYVDVSSNTTKTRAINGCLRPIMACNGMSIETNDGLYANAIGTDKPANSCTVVQDTLAKKNGSQCGYCSSGFVMTMHSLLAENRSDLTALEIEREFDGNLCRCTGYRPILAAMKTFATDTTTATEDEIGACAEPECAKTGCKNRGHKFGDIEEVPSTYGELMKVTGPVVARTHKKDTSRPTPKINATADGTLWQDCPTIADLNYWLSWFAATSQSIMLVVGQTTLGVTKKHVDVKLNISQIPELHGITSSSTGVTVGPSTTIRDLRDYLHSATAKTGEGYKIAHFKQAASHLHRVASQLVRNVGSVIGNMFLSYEAQTTTTVFCSDVVTVLFGLGATVTLYNTVSAASSTVDMNGFYTGNWRGCYATAINIPWGKQDEHFMSYKIAVRQVNSHAIVNAAMRCVVDPTTNKVKGNPTIIYGGLFDQQRRMSTVESLLVGLDITKESTLKSAVAELDKVVVPNSDGGRQAFRKSAAINYFYKFMLFLQPSVPSALATGTETWFKRPISSGTQSYQPNPNEYPVSIPMPKVESWMQTSGRAIYTDDIPAPAIDTIHATFIASTSANCDIDTIDTSQASSVDGFIKVYTAADIPAAQNNWQNGNLLCTGHVEYNGQVIGVCVAETEAAAVRAAKLVVVTYKNQKTPIVTVAQAVAAKSVLPPMPGTPPLTVSRGDPKTVIAAATDKVTSTFEIGSQYHLHMENHVSYCVPKEEAFEIHISTQAPVMVQQQIAATLGVPSSRVILTTKRCGGGYGGKITNSLLGSSLCAFVAQDQHRACRLIIDLQQTMQTLGNRGGGIMDYSVAYDKTTGKISALDTTLYCQSGYAPFDEFGACMVMVHNVDNSYNIPNFTASAEMMKMNIPASAPCRGPGWVTAVAFGEAIISRVASETGLSPDAVRIANMYAKNDTTPDGMILRYWNMPEIYAKVKANADWDTRVAAVQAYNAANRWTKKGINISPCRFGIAQGGANFDCLVNIYPDGTISITHGGSEIGQGINTKIIQVVAMKFGLDEEFALKNIIVDETSTRCISAPSNVTGGSITSGCVALAAMHACETLNARLAPYVAMQKPGYTWNQLIGMAAGYGCELTATGWTNAPNNRMGGIFNYNSTSAAVCEVLINCLTGELEIQRLDMVFDCGISMSPMIDVGQVEGGLVMGLGYHILEECNWDPSTGFAENSSTWDYKVPSAYDVPIKFNIELLKNSPNPVGVLSSKACGEPGVALSAVIVGAIEDAVTACHRDADATAKRYVATKLPLTPPRIAEACGVTASQYTFTA